MNLYLSSRDLNNDICSIVKEVQKHFPNVKYEEHIVVGLLDNMIVLRFSNLDNDKLTFDELAMREVKIRDIVQPNFIANFLGDNYEKFGLNVNTLKNTLHNCFRNLNVEKVMFKSVHQNKVKADIDKLKHSIGKNIEIWEIQVHDETMDILYFDDTEADIRTVNHLTYIPVKYDDSFKGIIQATYKAIQENQSLCEVLLSQQE